ncbi:acetyltransferase [Longispora fulva]|uniref:Ribosomal-protein-alanine N-acetyltransferase n=1 Tax=Longispora fulva TaxID=619741 RepID=A0A8J7G6L0_9ACTN|nr:GNAT family N-acetyltransferase [Longispora fulva]MBG6133825.1 ribosomal-protein-alanine N-acetyltransferase [Longispora fulva]GIG62864.1 acetyltransferase [Longispora fulva]
MRGPELTTGRLLLRRWRDGDREPFAALNGDPEVMEHFPSLQDRATSDGMVERIEATFDEHGFGLWAVALRESGEFLGFTGLQPVTFEASFSPTTEIGWRFARHAWGHGYATEAARAALAFGFDELGLGEIVAMTAWSNERSMAVMRRLGMRRDPAADFEHPRIPEGSPVRPHVLYRLGAADWRTA